MFPYARVFEVTHGSVMKETFFQREEQVNNKKMWNSSHQERRTKRKFEFSRSYSVLHQGSTESRNVVNQLVSPNEKN